MVDYSKSGRFFFPILIRWNHTLLSVHGDVCSRSLQIVVVIVYYCKSGGWYNGFWGWNLQDQMAAKYFGMRGMKREIQTDDTSYLYTKDRNCSNLKNSLLYEIGRIGCQGMPLNQCIVKIIEA